MEILTTNEMAMWLSLTITFPLLTVIAMQTIFPSSMLQHHIECLADVLLMVAGSDGFVTAVHEDSRAGEEFCGLGIVGECLVAD
jgi:hypothetical protein